MGSTGADVSLVARGKAFAVAYLSGEGEVLGLHAWSGYIIGGLILFPPAVGPVRAAHARFADFVFYGRQRFWAYAVTCCTDRRQRYSATTRWAAPWSSPCSDARSRHLSGIALYGAKEAPDRLPG